MPASSLPRVLLINAGRLNFDHRLDLRALLDVADVTVFDERTPDESDMRERVEASSPTAVITKEIPIRRELIESFPETVKLICEAGTGFNNIDLDAARTKGITVCNVPAYSTDAVATMVITFVLNFSSSLHLQQRALALGDHGHFAGAMSLPHFEVGGKVLGLVGGSGAIGSRVAAIAQALGMRVLVSSRSPRADAPYEMMADVGELLEKSDFISLHCPLNEQTRSLIDERALRRCKSTAYIINTARGAIINEADLIAALQSGTIAGAALDVQVQEPPPPDSPLYTLPNVMLTPHIGWQRLETRRAFAVALEHLSNSVSELKASGGGQHKRVQ